MTLPTPDSKDLQNFGWVCDWLARGADPNPAGFRWLAQAAQIKTIVNLRAEDNSEAALAPSLGFIPVQIPVVDNAPPSQEQAMQFLQLCAEDSTHPIFLHCQSGHGRTSTFCCLVRLAQGWKLDDAIDESVQHYGFERQKDAAQVAFLKGIHDLVKAGSLTLPALAV
ncbi:MAG: protein-tyrosine phosphatase family protein [Candidatus Baltobacteraceae bacterium]